MKKIIFIFAVSAICSTTLLLSGCEWIDSIKNINSLNERIANIEFENIALKMRIDDANKPLDFINKIAEEHSPGQIIDKLNTINTFGVLDIVDNRFSIVTTQYGSVALKCEEVKEYTSGTELTLKIGNLVSARLNDVSVKFYYKGDDVSNSKNFEITEKLDPSSWTQFKVVFPDIKPDKIKMIVYEVSIKGMGLRDKAKK